MKIEEIKAFHVDNMVIGKEEAEKHPSAFSLEIKDEKSRVFTKKENDKKKEIIMDE